MSKNKVEPVEDTLAERLENHGAWRRAAARWLDVIQQHELTCAQREWLWQRRSIVSPEWSLFLRRRNRILPGCPGQ